MPEAVLLILGLLALTGLASFVDIGQAEDDDPDREGPDDPEDGAPQTRILELTLEDQDIELANFDPTQDKLIIVSPSADISMDIEGDDAGSTLSIGYGDSTTTITGAWPDGEVGDSVIFRHMNDDGTTYKDYQVTFHESDRPEIGATPEFSVIGTGSTSINAGAASGIIHFNTESSNVQIQGSGHGAEEDIHLDEELAQFQSTPALKVYGATGVGSYVLANGSFSFHGRDNDDHVVVDDAMAVIHGGGGNDSVSVNDISPGRSQVIVYGEAGEDSLLGSEASDYIDGGRDTDIVEGHGGDDYIIGGAGADVASGGFGNDIIFGGIW